MSVQLLIGLLLNIDMSDLSWYIALTRYIAGLGDYLTIITSREPVILFDFLATTSSQIIYHMIFIAGRKVDIAMLVNGSIVECMGVVSTKLTNAFYL